MTVASPRCAALPAEITGFVGRRDELAELAATLREARLVTVTGLGGVGKTRLALRAAADIAAGYDGICLIELSGLRDPELLTHTVATALGLPEQDARSRLDAVLAFLRDRRMLLVLDTCEHVLDACAIFAETIAMHAPRVTILATSRQPLDTPGEHVFPVAPLPVTGPHPDAVDLFAQRAAAAAGFTLTDENLSDTVELCRRLDGIPLAIELAAVRLRAFPLPVLLSRLRHRFQVLTGGRRTAVPRHQTLRTTIEWSYELCSDAERDLWSRLSVFAGPFDIAAVEEICGGDVLTALVGLVDKSVVLRSGTRYRLLDTLREFGAERLADRPGEQTAIRARHVSRYLAMAQRFSEDIVTMQLGRFRALRREHDDIRAALEYALELEPRDAARIATLLDYYWHMSGLLRECGHWLSKVIDLIPETERAWALVVRAHCHAFQGMEAEAVADAERGIALSRESGQRLAAARGYLQLHLALSHSGEIAAAAAAAERAAESMRELGDTFGLLLNDVTTAYRHVQAGRLEEVVAVCDAALGRVPPGSTECYATGYLHTFKGLALFLRGDGAAGFAALSAGLRAKHEIGETVGTAYCLEFLAWLANGQNRHTRTAWLLGAADAQWELAGSRVNGNPVMEEFHRQAENAARGEDGYAARFSAGRDSPLDHVVRRALDDADDLAQPRPSAQPTRGDLTAREHEIATLVAQGLSNREIARQLVISKRTVDAHVEHIFAKLGVNSRMRIADWLRKALSAITDLYVTRVG